MPIGGASETGPDRQNGLAPPYAAPPIWRPPEMLHCSINSFRFLDFLLWFVLGPGGLREAPGGPGKAQGGLWGASRTLPGPGSKNLKTHLAAAEWTVKEQRSLQSDHHLEARGAHFA